MAPLGSLTWEASWSFFKKMCLDFRLSEVAVTPNPDWPTATAVTPAFTWPRRMSSLWVLGRG